MKIRNKKINTKMDYLLCSGEGYICCNCDPQMQSWSEFGLCYSCERLCGNCGSSYSNKNIDNILIQLLNQKKNTKKSPEKTEQKKILENYSKVTSNRSYKDVVSGK